jgi:hypothetical protein
MHSYQDTAYAVLDRYDVLYGGHKSDAGVCSDFHGFRFCITFETCW